MKSTHLPISSIAELHRLLELPPPAHPLVSVIDMSSIPCTFDSDTTHVTYSFYSICIKNGFKGKLKYGQNFYDFDNGVMTFFQPNQIISTVVDPDNKMSGWWLVFHPEFLLGYGLSAAMRDYGYFSYAVHEALHLSDKEEKLITAIMQQIAAEYDSAIDNFSQDVMISQIELVLNYCNRFYNRQFITRKHANNDLLSRLEAIL
ncbi:MAG: AraC family transcriptional regulator, partial [Proteobacteria bacterium]